MKLLLEDVVDIKDRLYELVAIYQESVKELKDATSDISKPLPPDKIYPMFMTLAKIWQQVEKEHSHLSARQNIYNKIIPFKISYTSVFPNYIASADVADSASTIQESLSTFHNSSGAELVDTSSISNLDKIQLEFKGFCPWTIIHRDGLLLKGDSAHYLIQFQGKFYACVSAQATNEVLCNPTSYIADVITAAKIQPELIFLLDLHSYFPPVYALGSVSTRRRHKLNISNQTLNSGSAQPSTVNQVVDRDYSKLFDLSSSEPLSKDMATQTELHPIPVNIDHSYHWNEWELRRRAIRLVELRHKKTHSTQTNNSHFRREVEAQHYVPKISSTQTGISSSTNMPIKKNYISNLRGKPSAKVKVVQLSLDL